TQAQSDVTTAQNALDAAKKMAEDARKMRDDAAGEAKRKIDEASDAGIPNRHWWQDVGHWFEDNWDTIVTVCKVVVAVVGIIAMIIGGPILGAIVLVAALVVLADTLYKYSQGRASLWDVAFAAMDCIPGGKGITSLGKLAKGVKEMKFLKGGLKAMAEGLGKKFLRKEADDAVAKSKPLASRCKNGDPVDMVTGEMVMAKTDFTLSGLLPVALRRTHLSGYRSGQWFGPSWSSTLDERVEVDHQGALFATEDGMILVYPTPSPGAATVLPVEGPRWPLSWIEGSETPLSITDPRTGLTRHFAPLKGFGDDQKAFTMPLRAISDRLGHRVTIDRTEDGTPTGLRHSGGHQVTVDTRDGRVRALALASHPEQPTLVRYTYDDLGNLAEVRDSTGSPYLLTYDGEDRVTSWTDRTGAWYRFTYDDRGRVVAGEGTDGFLNCAIAYDTDRRRTRYTDSLGFTTTYEYNELLQVTTQTDALGNTSHTEWDRYGNLVCRTDANGAQISLIRDGLGNVTSATRPDGRTLTATFNELSLPTRVVEADGTAWNYTYDGSGNLVQATDPTGASTTYHYDEAGHLSAVIDALGVRRAWECDGFGLLVGEQDSLGRTTRFERDAFGRVVAVIDPDDNTTELAWNTEGRIVRRTGPGGVTETWTYDGEGNLREHRAAGGATTRFEIGPFGLPKSRTEADGSRVEFVHDTELRLREVRVSDQGLVWSYVRDAIGRVTAETDFNGRSLTYGYDAVGRLIERTNGAGETSRFVRDALGKVVEQRCGDRLTSYTYDLAGRVVGAADEFTELTFSRDLMGRVLEESRDGMTARTAYDPVGRRTAYTTPSGAQAVWEYDTGNRPTALHMAGRESLRLAYDDAGHEVERLLFPGTVLTQDWGDDHRLTRQSLQGPGRHSWQRTFDHAADGVPVGGTSPDGHVTSFVLDGLGRVVERMGPAGAETYAYDTLGNVVHATWPAAHDAAQGERRFTGTLLRRAGRTRYEYDGQGRTVRRTQKLLNGQTRTWTYGWDGEDRLVRVVVPGGAVWHYRYDPLGRRSEKRHHDPAGALVERVQFVWDGARLAEQLHIDERAGASTTTTWQWKPDSLRPITQSERRTVRDLPQDEVDERFYAIVTDVTGTPTELVDEAGSVAWRAHSSLWGGSLAAGGSANGTHCPLRFPGQYHDEETGLHYNHFRYYEPDTARYQSPDPLGLEPALNHYAYVPNPAVWVDPLGLSCDEVDEEWTRVGRWMGDDEYNKMVSEGRAQPGAGDTSYVAHPPDPAAYGRQAKPGTSYVEYDVPLSSLRPAGEPGWSKIPGPTSLEGRMAGRKGLPVPEYPEVRNIEKVMSKEEWASGAG
ncbi:TreTu family toxin, partial [Streptomyces sp. NPDC002172]